MRKLLLLLMFVMASLAVSADSYTYLTFELTDGTKTSVSVSSLSITISGTTLTAGTETFTLSNLNKMYFSTSNETTGIKSISAAELNEATEVYDLNGHKVQKDQMQKGVYIVRSNSGTHKLVVK